MIKLEKILAVAQSVAGLAGIAVPVIGDVGALAGMLKSVAQDLEAVPVDPLTNKPLTLEAAQQHLDLAVTRSNAQDLQMQHDAEQRLKENHPDK